MLSRQKIYVDWHHCNIEFQVGDSVLWKVSPWKGDIYFHKWGKLVPRFIGPFRVIVWVGKITYWLDLLVELI